MERSIARKNPLADILLCSKQSNKYSKERDPLSRHTVIKDVSTSRSAAVVALAVVSGNFCTAA